ncbi:deoxynucleotide monophosphate kinase family protein [Chitinolyticbacter meiyuanensis]|uniref:deoxynucleotide monophosphate kinase family protein n=1 Tax=Chitinolyticbacter meiyuanensis TaxID=682798 RepID=UPI0011E5B982|nr:hypothetical protein [Chitinolyticbacter meiyuanensis]
MNLSTIALTGAKGAGKDTVADHLVRQHGYTKLAFADALRVEVATAWGTSTVVLLDRKLKEIPLRGLALSNATESGFLAWWLETTEAYAERAMGTYSADQLTLPRSPRWITQRWGDWRRAHDPQYWLAQMQAQIDALPGARIVITDVRTNPTPHQLIEVDFIGQLGGQLWQIRRPGTGRGDAHVTELPIPVSRVDQVIENTASIAELQQRVESLLAGVRQVQVEIETGA